jgi:iron complex outermembrane receptor protein
MKAVGPVALSAVFGLIYTGSALAQSVEEADLALAYGDKSFVSIATGARQPIARAPSVASVITAEDILALGARDLDEVLETVPGLHVSRSHIGDSPIYTIRGIRSAKLNPQVLMLVNGVPVTSVFAGDRGEIWGGLPVENIARIEVVRGPGSALYGADAFSGVINIITKDSAGVGGSEFGARAGTFDTWDAWTQHGLKVGETDLAFYLRRGATHGQREIVSADQQTFFDSVFGTSASHAPGPVDTGYRATDFGLDVSRDKWRFRAGLKEREDVGSGAGIAQALDPTGQNYSRRITADITYQDPKFSEHWDVTLQASYMYYNEQSDLVLFPAGANLGGGAFADGMIGNPYKWERHGRLGASAFYSGFERHRLRFGAGYNKEDLYRVRETKNFNPDFSPIGTGSRNDIIDVSDTNPFMRPHDRDVRYGYAQDEWNLAQDWTLTAGVRHDRYSDFGSTTNPRLALVWEAAYNVTTKLLYGTAFRAPAFTELYAINNPVVIGNPNLDPERIRTTEVAVMWQPAPTLRLGANLFHYEIRDLIRLDSSFTYQNIGRQTGKGMELETAWDPLTHLRVTANYGLQRSIDEATDKDAGLAPQQRVYLRTDWRLLPDWSLNTQVNWVADRAREPGDARPALDDYTTVDITLRAARIQRAWDLAFSIRNLFDADAREPSPNGSPVAPIPNDLPLPGRWYLLQARLQL